MPAAGARSPGVEPADEGGADVGTVTVFDPPNAIQFTMNDGFMRFDLERDGDGTRLRFTHSFVPGAATEPAEYDGADQPAGPDTPWRPGFVAGFHQMLDQLDLYLRGEWTASDRAHHLEEMIAGRPDAEYLRLIDVYRSTSATTARPTDFGRRPIRSRRGDVDGRPAIGPRPCRFELRRETEERGLVAEATEEVHPDRHAVGVPPQRNRHRRIAGDVGDHARVARSTASRLARLLRRAISPIGSGGVDNVGVSQTSTSRQERRDARENS